MATEEEYTLPWLGVKLSEMGALHDVWIGDEEREAWVDVPLHTLLELLAEHDRQVAEKAWDEGWNSRWDNSVTKRHIDNPYRRAS